MSNSNPCRGVRPDEDLSLGIPGFFYSDIHSPQRLKDLHDAFIDTIKQEDPELLADYSDYKNSQGEGYKPQVVSELLIRLAPHVGNFVAKLFKVENSHEQDRIFIEEELNTVFLFRTKVVSKVNSRFKNQSLDKYDIKKVWYELDVLRHIGFGQDIEIDDLEKAISIVGCEIEEIKEHYSLTTDNKKYSDDDMNARIGLLRKKIEADEASKEVFSESISITSNEGFIESLFTYVERWVFVAQHDERSKSWSCFKMASKKDFDNLLSVYLDAVFFSRLDPLDFAQEGHRIEFENEDGTGALTFKGVVFRQ